MNWDAWHWTFVIIIVFFVGCTIAQNKLIKEYRLVLDDTSKTLIRGKVVMELQTKEIARDDAILAGIFGKWNRKKGLASLPVDVLTGCRSLGRYL